MLTPEYLDGLPEEILNLYAKAEEEILADMARRVSTYDYWIPSAEYQRQKLREAGALEEEILKALSDMTGKSEAELKRLMQQAGTKTLESNTAVYVAAGVNAAQMKQSAPLREILNTGYRQTAQTMRNLCRTTAHTATGQFENALDLAWLKVQSGAFDAESAIRTAVKSLAEQGLQSIRYPSGKTDTLETAVRRAVITGVNQTSGQLQEELADELECDLVEVSAHSGARPEHALWQGKIYSRSGKDPKYPPFRQSTGYGTGAGLCGWNCHHTFGPYVEGSPPVWTQEKLAELDAPKYEYNGKRLTEYEASQQQRYNERQIRRWKREYAAMDAAGLDTSEAAVKVKEWQARQRNFLSQTGFKRQYGREQIAVANPQERGIIKSLDIDDFELMAEINEINPKVTDTILSVIREYEDAGIVYINDFYFGSIPRESNGTPLLQIEPISDKRLRLNVNTDIFGGRTIEEINKMLANSPSNLAQDLREAVIHECGHAKSIMGLSQAEIKTFYEEIANSKITGISKIAYLDGAEALAEIEILISRGEKIPTEAYEFYKKYYKGAKG